MTHHSPLRYALGLAVAATLTACGGGGPGVSETAAEAGVSADDPADDTGSQDSDTGTDDRGDDQSDDPGDGQPGGPGDDGVDGGGGDGGGGGGNPGGPGDVLVFEESNVKFGGFRDTGSGHQVCEVEGSCTLAEPHPISGEKDPETGFDDCLISSFVYSPASRPNPDPEGPRDVFLEGATVTALVKCEPDDEDSHDADPSQSETSESETSDSDTPDSDTSDTSDTPDSTVDDSGTDDPAVDDPPTDDSVEPPQ